VLVDRLGPQVSVVIVGYNNANDVVRCLSALSACTYPNFSILICENGGLEAFARLQAAVPSRLESGQPVMLILAPTNLGFAGGVNHAIRYIGHCQAFWILNPDTAPAATTLELMMLRLSAGDCDAVGCRLVLPTGSVQSYGGRWNSWIAQSTSIGFGDNGSAKPAASLIETKQNYLNGASMLTSHRFIEVAGLMREDYFLYCEEVEWFIRAAKLGLRLGYADADVLHYHGTTTGGGRGMAGASQLAIFMGERNRLLLTRDTDAQHLVVAIPLSLFLVICRCLRHRAFHQLRPAIAGWWSGVSNQRGKPPDSFLPQKSKPVPDKVNVPTSSM
jgi:N-acetylglucosaminyl-diphospho-decaprenol L-rhamnosyltransferase